MSYMPHPPPGADQQEDLPPGIPAPPPGYFLGIDAGGSLTRAVLLADGRLANRVTAPPMNALLSADLDERLAGLITPGSRRLGIGMRLGPLPVCGMGGVLTSPVIWDRFAELTGAVRSLAPPETGAALMAGSPRAEFIRAGNNTLSLMNTGGNSD